MNCSHQGVHYHLINGVPYRIDRCVRDLTAVPHFRLVAPVVISMKPKKLNTYVNVSFSFCGLNFTKTLTSMEVAYFWKIS
jgi:hypothetical protein